MTKIILQSLPQENAFDISLPFVVRPAVLADVLDAVDGGLAGVLLGLLFDPMHLVLVVKGLEGGRVPGHHAPRGGLF